MNNRLRELHPLVFVVIVILAVISLFILTNCLMHTQLELQQEQPTLKQLQGVFK
jgi:hypothetical protein